MLQPHPRSVGARRAFDEGRTRSEPRPRVPSWCVAVCDCKKWPRRWAHAKTFVLVVFVTSLGSHTSSMRSGLFLVWMCEGRVDVIRATGDVCSSWLDDDSNADSFSVSVGSGVMCLFMESCLAVGSRPSWC